MIAAVHAPLARVLAGRAGLRALDGPDATFALAAVEHDAEAIGELIGQLEDARIDPRVQAGSRARPPGGHDRGRGHRRSSPCSCCSATRAPADSSCASRRSSAPGGATVPLTLESWRLIEEQLRGWISPGAQALRRGAEARAARRRRRCSSSPRSTTSRRSCSRPGTTPRCSSASRRSPARRRRRGTAGAARARAPGEHAALPAIRADPFCVPELDEFLADARDLGRARGARRCCRRSARSTRSAAGPGGALGRDRRAARGARTSAAS